MQNQAVIQDTDRVLAELMELAKQRNEMLLSDNSSEKNYDGYLTPLLYQSPDGDMFYGIQLPQCFPTMTIDILTILEWYVSNRAIVRRGQVLVEVQSNYGDIVIPMPPTLRGQYRVMQLVKAHNEQIRMGDLLIILQITPAHKVAKRKVA